jgi:zinc protease
MSNFRSIAPPSDKIVSLSYSSPKKKVLGHNTPLYLAEPRQNEVVKLLWYWPFGTRNQETRFQARSALSLSLNGTAQHSAEEIQEQFDFWGTSIGSDTGIFSSEITLKSTKEYYIDSLKWLVTNHLNASFPQTEIENFQQIEIASLQRKLATPRYWANRLGMESLFGPDSPNTRFTSEKDILDLNAQQLQGFHRNYLNPASATWILSGDLDPQVIEATEALILDLSAPSLVPTNNEAIHNFKPHVEQIRKSVENTSQVSMFLARKVPAIGETEYHLFSLLNLILGGFFGSRLMQEIREERGLTYGIGSYIAQTTEGNLWCISGEMNSASAEEAEVATRELMLSLIENPPTGNELERAKRYYAGQLRTSFDGPFSMPSKIKGLLTRGYTFRHYDTALDSIWAATTDDLCQLANNYLRPETFHSVLAGDIS